VHGHDGIMSLTQHGDTRPHDVYDIAGCHGSSPKKTAGALKGASRAGSGDGSGSGSGRRCVRGSRSGCESRCVSEGVSVGLWRRGHGSCRVGEWEERKEVQDQESTNLYTR
jgi:hypothetical protein